MPVERRLAAASGVSRELDPGRVLKTVANDRSARQDEEDHLVLSIRKGGEE
jgi:hypothetical protein